MRKLDKLQVLNQDGQLVVTSREVSENFKKAHKNVIQSLETLISQMGGAEKSANLFIESEYQDEQNKQMYKEYLLTRDGFSLLVMGFTGAKALEWKLKYIQAFNEMEQSLKKPQLLAKDQLRLQLQILEEQDKKIEGVSKKVDNLEDNLPLFNIECKELQALVRKVGIKALGGYHTPAYKNNSLRGKVYSDIQHQLKREFGIERYEAIKRIQLEKAHEIVSGYKAPTILIDEIQLENNQVSFSKGVN